MLNGHKVALSTVSCQSSHGHDSCQSKQALLQPLPTEPATGMFMHALLQALGIVVKCQIRVCACRPSRRSVTFNLWFHDLTIRVCSGAANGGGGGAALWKRIPPQPLPQRLMKTKSDRKCTHTHTHTGVDRKKAVRAPRTDQDLEYFSILY